MSQIVSIILVIVMALSSVAGLNAGMEDASSFEVKISVDGAQIAAMGGQTGIIPEAAAEDSDGEAEAAPDLPAIISDVSGVISLRGYTDRESVEVGLFANDDALLTLGVKNNEEGAVFASSALGSNVLTISRMMLDMMQQQMTASMTQSSSGMDIQSLLEKLQGLNAEQAGKDITEALGSFGAAVSEKVGEPEKGEFTVDGFTFTVKTPVNISYEELMELLLTTAKDLLNRESLKPLVETMASANSDPVAAVDQALEDLRNLPEDLKYDLSMDAYSADDGVTAYFAADLSREASADGSVEADRAHAGLGTIEGQTGLVLTKEDGTSFKLTAATDEDGATRFQLAAVTNGTEVNLDALAVEGATDLMIGAKTQAGPFQAHIVSDQQGDASVIQAEIFMNGADAPLAELSITSGKGGEHMCAYEGEDLTVTPYESLMSSEGQTEITKLTTTIMMGLMKAISTLKTNLPEATGNWIFNQLMQTVTPAQTTPATGN